MVEPTRILMAKGFVPAGTRLSGIYEIDAPLAKGGMGEIYRGHAIETGDAVAIKLIRADMADNEAALALFRREASALNRLHHEAIVRYFVFSLDPGLQRHYLAMELVEGVSLSELLSRGPLDVADTLGLLRRIASGLQAAHERGIVHRDISPDNIIVHDGDVSHARIIDFGIARSTRVGDSTVIGGGFAGKYNYVSPEQLGLFGGDVTGQSDIYSLGLVLAQCVRGRPLDMGGSQAEIIDKRRAVPDLGGVDAAIRPLLERMLQPHPRDRPATMTDVVASLTSGGSRGSDRKTARPVAAPRAASKSRGQSRSLTWTIAAVAGVALAGAAAFVGYLMLADPWKFEPPAPSGNPPSAAGEAPPETHVAAPVLPEPRVAAPVDAAAAGILRFIRNYNGGPCFLALPGAVTAQSAEIEAFAAEKASFDAFDADFRKANGWEATIDGGQVAPGQCAALGFVRALQTGARAAPANLEIGKTRVKAGEVLEGSLDSASGNAVLLLIEEDGKVHDVTSQVTGAGPRRNFAMRLSRGPGPRAHSMLLLAVTSARPIAALRPAQPTPSGQVFAAARADGEAQAGSLEVAVKYFKLD